MIKVVKQNFKKLSGEIVIPSDKSLSHRAAIFGALACGKSIIKNFSKGQDPQSSLKVVRALGCEVIRNDNNVELISNGILKKPQAELYCGNSGTTMRLMSGILAGQNFSAVLTGDESLSKRPMKRVITPLSLMGAKITSNNYMAPLKFVPTTLHSIPYNSEIASAQVKSCVLLAGLKCDDITTFVEPYLSRNHTEIMLKNMGAKISTNNTTTTVSKSDLAPINTTIPGDISSGAYFIAAGLLVPNSEITIKNIGLNSTRTGIIDVVSRMGATIEILDKRNVFGEMVGDIRIKYCDNLKSVTLEGEIIPNIIDEIPIIAVIATQANGTTVIKDAQDLRNKESDRIKTVVTELKKLGANIEETPDGMIIHGKTQLIGDIKVNSYCDHRIAMSLFVAGLVSQKEIAIQDFEWVNISFPEFEEIFSQLIY